MGSISREILHNAVPEEVLAQAAARLPSMKPVVGPWLVADEAYAAQMQERRRLLDAQTADVHAQLPDGLAAARVFLETALDALPDGFTRAGDTVICPDGAYVTLDWDQPLKSIGRIIQQDVCILEARDDEHVLTGACLCFPASWTLSQKIGRPLIGIHVPVDEYDADIAKRVQRLFDGVRPERPMWRANMLPYDDAMLFQPRREGDPRPVGSGVSDYIRSERQTVLRLPHPGAVAFVIHTYVVRNIA